MSETGRSAYNWDIYKNRRSALQHLKRNSILVDTILETEDGLSCEYVHSQVMSAFGDKLSNHIRSNGTYVTRPLPSSYTADVEGARTASSALSPPIMSQVKLVKLPRVNRYTLGVLIDCAYTGYIRTDLPSGGIWQVLEMAEHYELKEMISACCNFLHKNLNRSNCIQFYHIGAKHRHQLQRSAWHKIRANFKHLLFSSGDNFNPNENSTGPSNQITNPLASIRYEHFELLLQQDRLNVDSEESVWEAIRMWCNTNPSTSKFPLPLPFLPSHSQPDGGMLVLEDLDTRRARVVSLLPCIRFPRFRSGPDFPQQCMWRDPLVMGNRQAQHQLAALENWQHQDLLSSPAGSQVFRDGNGLPCASQPRQLRPRVPHSILLAIGGWQQGQPSRLIESYDANCNLWFESSHRISAPLAYHGIEFIDGLLYVCGGTDGTEILNEVFTFDPVLGDCSQRPSMREARCYVSTAHLDGHLYAMGGHNGSVRMRSVERYQVSAQSSPWMPVHDMNVARSDASACVREQLIYIAGGLNDQLIEASVEFYNRQDDTWTFLTSMVTPRTSFALLLYQDSLLAIGGNNGRERLASVEQYSFFTKLWSAHSSMLHRRSTFSAALLDERRLVVVGGYNGQTPFSQVEMWDEGVRRWVSLHKIRFDRSGLKVVAVSELSNALDYTFLGQATASSSPEPQASAMLAAGPPLAPANNSNSGSNQAPP